jgi:HD-like signal output (HDOD) protein
MSVTPNETAPREFEGRLSKDRDWREIVAWVGDLPPMPQVASRAISMVENPDTTANEMTDLLSTDAALAARVLKIANSAMFSRQREITTLSQAIMIIGFKALKGIVVAATLRQINKSFGALEKLIWEASMCSAACSTVLAKKLRKPFVEEVFLLGLLHNLGQIVLLYQSETARDYKGVIKLIKERGLDYTAAEHEVFGFAHSLIGALVAKKWNFSPDSCQVILHYKDPLDGDRPETPLEHKTAIVQLAELITHAAGVGNPEGYPKDHEAIMSVAKYVGFDTRDLEKIMQDIITETQQQFQNERHVYE